MLLKFLDTDIAAHSKSWFQSNMLALKEEDVPRLIGRVGGKKSNQTKQRLRAYRMFMGQDARGSRQHIPKELRDTLDGEAWE